VTAPDTLRSHACCIAHLPHARCAAGLGHPVERAAAVDKCARMQRPRWPRLQDRRKSAARRVSSCELQRVPGACEQGCGQSDRARLAAAGMEGGNEFVKTQNSSLPPSIPAAANRALSLWQQPCSHASSRLAVLTCITRNADAVDVLRVRLRRL
jgi:hypothetical protein